MTRTRLKSGRRGSAMTEFALCSSLLILITIGGTDLGRIFSLGTSLAQAAKAGAHYGGYSKQNSTDTAGIIAAARAAAPGVSMNVATSRACICGETGQAIDCSTGVCASLPKIYLEVRAEGVYSAFLPVWGNSPTVPVSSVASVRLQ